MIQKKTTIAERNEFVDLKLAGNTIAEIAEKTGWTFYCVRYWWRQFREGGREALAPEDKRKQRGLMSKFPGVVRFAMLRIKKEHPGWGAPVARLQATKNLNMAPEELPSVSTIEKYWAQYKRRLYKRHRKRYPIEKSEPKSKPEEPHERWQADFKIKMQVSGLGKADVFNVRDDASPVKIGSFVRPSGEWDDRQVQDALRKAFARWGLCDRFQTDRDTRLVSVKRNPFPTRFILWLVGLGIEHEIAKSAPANGCVERFHRTWFDRVIEGSSYDDLSQLQACSDQALDWINEELPSRGRNCQGRPPLQAYPDARLPRRPFNIDEELAIFSIQRVYEYLSTQSWWRTVSKVGQTGIAGHYYTVGLVYARQDVKFTFDPQTMEFVVKDAQDVEIKRIQPINLTVEEITGLKPDPT
jgi:transposase-like protein